MDLESSMVSTPLITFERAGPDTSGPAYERWTQLWDELREEDLPGAYQKAVLLDKNLGGGPFDAIWRFDKFLKPSVSALRTWSLWCYPTDALLTQPKLFLTYGDGLSTGTGNNTCNMPCIFLCSELQVWLPRGGCRITRFQALRLGLLSAATDRLCKLGWAFPSEWSCVRCAHGVPALHAGFTWGCDNPHVPDLMLGSASGEQPGAYLKRWSESAKLIASKPPPVSWSLTLDPANWYRRYLH